MRGRALVAGEHVQSVTLSCCKPRHFFSRIATSEIDIVATAPCSFRNRHPFPRALNASNTSFADTNASAVAEKEHGVLAIQVERRMTLMVSGAQVKL
jgi:hypothetical protein